MWTTKYFYFIAAVVISLISPSQTINNLRPLFGVWSSTNSHSLSTYLHQATMKAQEELEEERGQLLEHRQLPANSSEQLQLPDELLDEAMKQALLEMQQIFNASEHDAQKRSSSAGYTSRLHNYHRRPLPSVLNDSFVAMTTLRATRLIRDSMRLDRTAVLLKLPEVNISKSALTRSCPDRFQRTSGTEHCNSSAPYRTTDGTCNNLEHPLWGAATSPFVRLLLPDYADDVQEPRVGAGGRLLPGARRVSSELLSQSWGPKAYSASRSGRPGASLMVMQWGQFVDHDLSHTPMSTASAHGDSLQCCINQQQQRRNVYRQQQQQQKQQQPSHPQCFPIAIDSEDSLYKQHGQRCMEFARSVPAVQRHCSLGPREQVNQVSSYMDASNLYGSSQQQTLRLRQFSGGRLKAPNKLPPTSGPPGSCVASSASVAEPSCFEAGDSRVNETPDLTSVHTIWLREHNRIASGLEKICTDWDDEHLFQETRRLVAALQQHITYTEWLPVVLGALRRPGDNQVNADGIASGNISQTVNSAVGEYIKYDANIDASISNVFATAAMRFGHTLVPDSLELFTPWHSRMTDTPLHKHYFRTESLRSAGKVDEFISGLVNANSSTADNYLVENIRNRLFERPGQGFGLDLGALNIQRGRDHGIPSYNQWRKLCQLEPQVETFSDLETYMNSEAVKRLSEVYIDVNDIDLYVGSLLEPPVENGLVGETMGCLLAHQFSVLRSGDRFWHENTQQPHPLTKNQLVEVKKSSLARVVCENSALATIQRNVMLKPSNENPRVRCNALPTIDLSVWAKELGCSRSSPSYDSKNPEDPSISLATTRRTLLPAHWPVKPYSERAPFPPISTPAATSPRPSYPPWTQTRPVTSSLPQKQPPLTGVTPPFVFNMLDRLSLSTYKPLGNGEPHAQSNQIQSLENTSIENHQFESNTTKTYTRFPPRQPRPPPVSWIQQEDPSLPSIYTPPDRVDNNDNKRPEPKPNTNHSISFDNNKHQQQYSNSIGYIQNQFQQSSNTGSDKFQFQLGSPQTSNKISNYQQQIITVTQTAFGSKSTAQEYPTHLNTAGTTSHIVPTVTIDPKLWPLTPGGHLVLYVSATTGPIFYTVTPTPLVPTVSSCRISTTAGVAVPVDYGQSPTSSQSNVWSGFNTVQIGATSQNVDDSATQSGEELEGENEGITSGLDVSKEVQVVDSPFLHPSTVDLTTYRDSLIITNRPSSRSTPLKSSQTTMESVSISRVSIYTRFPARPQSLIVQEVSSKRPLIVTSLLWGGGSVVTHRVEWPSRSTNSLTSASSYSQFYGDGGEGTRKTKPQLSFENKVISIRPGTFPNEITQYASEHLITVSSTLFSIHTLTTLTTRPPQSNKFNYLSQKKNRPLIHQSVLKYKKPIIIKQIIRTIGTVDLNINKKQTPVQSKEWKTSTKITSTRTNLLAPTSSIKNPEETSLNGKESSAVVFEPTTEITPSTIPSTLGQQLTPDRLSQVLFQWHQQNGNEIAPQTPSSGLTLLENNSLEVPVRSRCVAVGFWKRLPNMNSWCTFNCLQRDPPSCPIAHCRCM